MRVAITGSRHGLKDGQFVTLVDLCSDTILSEFHYGDCVGVDEAAMWICHSSGHDGVFHSHPATMNPEWDAKWRARTAERFPELGIIEYEAKHPLTRNKDMVDACDVLWAFPESAIEKGGTWHTVNYARSKGVPVELVLP